MAGFFAAGFAGAFRAGFLLVAKVQLCQLLTRFLGADLFSVSALPVVSPVLLRGGSLEPPRGSLPLTVLGGGPDDRKVPDHRASSGSFYCVRELQIDPVFSGQLIPLTLALLKISGSSAFGKPFIGCALADSGIGAGIIEEGPGFERGEQTVLVSLFLGRVYSLEQLEGSASFLLSPPVADCKGVPDGFWLSGAVSWLGTRARINSGQSSV